MKRNPLLQVDPGKKGVENRKRLHEGDGQGKIELCETGNVKRNRNHRQYAPEHQDTNRGSFQMMPDTSLEMSYCKQNDEDHRPCYPQDRVPGISVSPHKFDDHIIEGKTTLRSNQKQDCLCMIFQNGL